MSNENMPLDEEQTFNYTHGIRKSIVSSLMKEGKVPSDIKEIQMLSTVLTDMDRTAISIKKIKSDEKVADKNSASSAAIVANLLSSLNVRNSVLPEPNSSIVPPTLGDDIPAPDLKPGETTIGTSTLDYDSFNNKKE